MMQSRVARYATFQTGSNLLSVTVVYHVHVSLIVGMESSSQTEDDVSVMLLRKPRKWLEKVQTTIDSFGQSLNSEKQIRRTLQK